MKWGVLKRRGGGGGARGNSGPFSVAYGTYTI